MSSEQNEKRRVPVLCVRGCGFYGNPANQNLCSKCHREFQQQQDLLHQKANVTQKVESNQDKLSGSMECSTMASRILNDAKTALVGGNLSTESSTCSTDCRNSGPKVRRHDQSKTNKEVCGSNVEILSEPVAGTKSDSPSEQSPKSVVDSQPSRCAKCSKKVGLLGFTCKCGLVFCGSHRYAEDHDCTFDYKQYERSQLAKRISKVVADKLERF